MLVTRILSPSFVPSLPPSLTHSPPHPRTPSLTRSLSVPRTHSLTSPCVCRRCTLAKSGFFFPSDLLAYSSRRAATQWIRRLWPPRVRARAGSENGLGKHSKFLCYDRRVQDRFNIGLISGRCISHTGHQNVVPVHFEDLWQVPTVEFCASCCPQKMLCTRCRPIFGARDLANAPQLSELGERERARARARVDSECLFSRHRGSFLINLSLCLSLSRAAPGLVFLMINLSLRLSRALSALRLSPGPASR